MMGGALASKHVNIIQGEYRVGDDPEMVLTTLLGSCVSACIRDPALGIGGMNHFLLPGGVESERMGVHLMELLLNGLMRRGAQRERLEAKIFGGARMMEGLSDIGKRNADFARSFLDYEGIRVVGGDLGGERGRRLQFWPVSGRARQSYIANGPDLAPRPISPPPPSQGAGDVDLF
jgi:chemotaxis protein CheD